MKKFMRILTSVCISVLVLSGSAFAGESYVIPGTTLNVFTTTKRNIRAEALRHDSAIISETASVFKMTPWVQGAEYTAAIFDDDGTFRALVHIYATERMAEECVSIQADYNRLVSELTALHAKPPIIQSPDGFSSAWKLSDTASALVQFTMTTDDSATTCGLSAAYGRKGDTR